MSLEEACKRLEAEVALVRLLKAVRGEPRYDLAKIIPEAEAVLDACNEAATPIPMVLHCPRCGLQHVDQAEPDGGWTNPPHRSHLCHGCAAIWRPADIATCGVASIETTGASDTWAPGDATLRDVFGDGTE